MNYVKANFNWNQNNSKYSTKSPGELLKDKYGNDADLNLLATGLLNSAGIEAYPLLISTRENGKVKKDYPLINSFNYIIIYAVIDEKVILTDATEILCPNDLIPSRCLNEKGLLIREGPVEWVNLQSLTPSEIQTVFKIDSLDTGALAKTSISVTRYDAIRYRKNYGEDKKKLAERASGDDYTVDEQSIEILNAYVKDQSYEVSYNVKCKTEVINKKIYISPFLNEPITENPLRQNSRAYPVDMLYPIKRSFTSSVTIPDGYKIEFKPEDEKILNDLFELYFHLDYHENTITVTFSYAFKKPLYEAKDYSGLKYYFREIIKKGNEKVVLVKS